MNKLSDASASALSFLPRSKTDGNWNTFEVTIGEGGSLSQGNQPVMSDPPKDWINISPVAHYRLVQKRGLVCQEVNRLQQVCVALLTTVEAAM